ncbi:MAG: site-specific DNA-methyltransferase [Phycisphaerae bacterium]|nr:site-specific DNA-methyltransferase [Phycisphaerae bacterium]
MAKEGKKPAMDRLYKCDCLKFLARFRKRFVHLVFADPPFNIGYKYDQYCDKMEYEAYVDWTRKWMAACQRVLRPDGSFYIAIGDEFAAEVRTIGRELGLHLRNWIIWHYTFGQQTKNMFARSHTHIFYFVMDPTNFVFNDTHVRFPSARHTEYSDKRADPMGRVPDNTWDEFPRVCGTFREREGWHGCQMPESLLMRIIRASSNPGDVVLDPFSGSGTTLVSAAKLGRHYLGTDLSDNYVAYARKRLGDVQAALKGDTRFGGWSALAVDTLCSLYRETGTARTNLTPNAVAMDCFTRLLNVRLGTSYTADEVAAQLEALDRAVVLPRLRNDRPYKRRQPQAEPRLALRRRARSDEPTLWSEAM